MPTLAPQELHPRLARGDRFARSGPAGGQRERRTGEKNAPTARFCLERDRESDNPGVEIIYRGKRSLDVANGRLLCLLSPEPTSLLLRR